MSEWSPRINVASTHTRVLSRNADNLLPTRDHILRAFTLIPAFEPHAALRRGCGQRRAQILHIPHPLAEHHAFPAHAIDVERVIGPFCLVRPLEEEVVHVHRRDCRWVGIGRFHVHVVEDEYESGIDGVVEVVTLKGEASSSIIPSNVIDIRHLYVFNELNLHVMVCIYLG